MSCQSDNKKAETDTASKPVQLVTLDPGHFHAALVQKTMYDNVDSVVYVYAPEGDDLNFHLGRINGYNSRKDSPTNWKEKIYVGPDFFEKLIADRKAIPPARLSHSGGDDLVARRNVVVLSGNNGKKTEYILDALKAGFDVFADKPMAITTEDFELLKEAFGIAKEKGLLLYDIMTERFEINTILQKEISMIPEIFGELEKGSPDNPAISKESVHHFYKYVSGSILTRPAWFMDVNQQGEGIVDVMTHLVDLVQWECFPEQVIDTKDISFNTAKRWPTDMRLSEFRAITKLDRFPSYLDKYIINDSVLQVHCNGEINYTIRGVHARTSVIWNYKAPEGTGDTHHSIMRGTKANLVINQGKEENYQPTLYIEPISNNPFNPTEAFNKIQTQYPGVELKEMKLSHGNSGHSKWQVIIPDKYKEGHEAHFGRVMEKFLEYLENKNMPAWEIPNMLTKYYTTTRALEIALKKK